MGLCLAETVNLIIEKFGGDRVSFMVLGTDFVTFVRAGVVYRVAFSSDSLEVGVWRWLDGKNIVDNYSRWIEGVLNGKTRNAIGDLVAMELATT